MKISPLIGFVSSTTDGISIIEHAKVLYFENFMFYAYNTENLGYA